MSNLEECVVEGASSHDYNLGLHIAGIFVILAVAAIGTILPVLGKTIPRLKLNDYTFLLLKCFGMGIILATGFVHMFVPADENLRNPCLPEGFRRYDAWAGLIALLSCLLVQFIQTAAINHFAKKHTHGTDACDPHEHLPATHVRSDRTPSNATDPEKGLGSSTSAFLKEEDQQQELDDIAGPLLLQPAVPTKKGRVKLGALAVAHNIHSDGCCEVEHAILSGGEKHEHMITTYILEFGIALHSLIIGITLGVTPGTEFITLLIAISFHQFFEGFALSATALEAGFDDLKQPLLMALFYTLTTPIGQAIGIAISSSFEGSSPTSLMLIGIFDAISAGILIYDALVNLVTTNITHSRFFENLTITKKAYVFISLWCGAGIMSLIGMWI